MDKQLVKIEDREAFGLRKRAEGKPPRIMRAVLLCAVCAIVMLTLLAPVLNGGIIGAPAFANANDSVLESSPEPNDLPETQLPTSTPAPTPSFAPPETDSITGYAIAVSAYPTLRMGDDNVSVMRLQMRLMEIGYLDYDEPSTVYNEATKAAVMLFQRSMGLEMTGIAYSDLQELLYSDNVQLYVLRTGYFGDDVRSLQERLHELGYYNDKISGYYGPRTADAVRTFKLKNRLDADGEVSYTDRKIIYSSSAIPKTTPTPKPTAIPENRTAKPTAKATPKATSSGKASATPKSTGGAAADSPKPTDSGSSGGGSYSGSASGLIACAKDQMGKPYVWSTEGPDSFDCSGLVYYCLRSCGVKVSRWSAHSYADKSSWTRIDSISDLKAGDLVFFKSDDSSEVNHTGIYIGGGSFIHASSSSGKVVKSSFSSSDSTKYWNRNFVCGRRVF